jgi:8-oxo-dGTP diphosphatase
MKLQIGVKALIENSDGLYLFLQRSNGLASSNDIRWDIPGGRIDEGEALRDALTREIREETGLILDSSIRLLDAQDIILPEKDLHVVRLTYLTTIDGDVKLSDEHQDHRWANLTEAADLHVDEQLHAILESL